MKKFLFTLVALFAGANAFAISYLGAPDVELTEAQLGTTINLDLYAYFGEMVSSYEVFVGSGVDENFVEGQMPAGLEVTAMSQLGTARITYIGYVYNEDDDEYVYQETVCTPSFSTSGNYHGLAITSALDTEYALIDGEYVSCTAIKWKPGEFKMLRLKVAIASDFREGDIVVKTMPACGQDPRGPICGNDPVYDTIHIGLPQQDEPTDFVGTADVTFNENIATISYTSNDPNASVVVTVNGEELTDLVWNDGVATWAAPVYTTPGEYRYEVTITVTPDGVNYVGTPATDTDVFSYTILETTATPTITIVDENAHHCYFTVEGDGVVTVLVDGQPAQTIEVDGETYYVIYAVEGEPVDYVITATAKEDNKYESAPATENYHFDAWDAVNELVNGKTVANVRYYNMAGQEMQSVNGLTIKVTTYTDGTTSAVKVMK